MEKIGKYKMISNWYSTDLQQYRNEVEFHYFMRCIECKNDVSAE